MAFHITEDCTACGACESECPNSAISSGDDRYVIAAAKCTECVGFHKTPACSSVCPVDAPQADPAHAENEAALKAKVKALYPGKTFAEPMPSRFV